jgi:chemotaxis response regulator CheB
VRVLVADDAVLFRRLLADVLASLPGVEVVGSASNGRIALQKIRELKPDLLTLDIEMPEMDGLAVLDALVQNGKPEVEVIVVSAFSRCVLRYCANWLPGFALWPIAWRYGQFCVASPCRACPTSPRR